MADAAQSELGVLPEWDLSDLYPGPDSEALTKDLEKLAADAKAFKQRYAGKIAGLDGTELGRAIQAYELMDEITGRIMSYAYLVYAGDMSSAENGKFFQSMQEKVNAAGTDLLFFTLEINRIEEADLEVSLKAPELAFYKPWLRDVRAFRDHQLSDEIEEKLHEKSVTGKSAWVRLFDEPVLDGGDVQAVGDQVVHQIRIFENAPVVHHLFEQGVADPLGHPSVDLSFQGTGVHDLSDVV